jgi:hypothetical protein
MRVLLLSWLGAAAIVVLMLAGSAWALSLPVTVIERYAVTYCGET